MKNFLILSFLAFFSVNIFAKENIVVYTYHKHAPFIIDKKNGLTYDLVKLLNSNSQDYNFILKVVPRSRLNYILKPWINKNCIEESKRCSKNWIVLWVNHKWGFGNDSLKNFLWTPVLEDSNAIISNINNKFEYKNPTTLINKTLLGISGHKYVGIDTLVNEGQIIRINGDNEVYNLNAILNSKADVTLLPKSAFNYYQKINSKFNELYVSKTPHQKYMRNIMTNNKNKKLAKYLDSLNFELVIK